MNTATSVSPTSTLGMNNVFSDQVTLSDYPVQTGRSSGNDLPRNNSGYRRLTLREKAAKQRSERENEAKANVDNSTKENSPKTTSVGGASSSATTDHRPTARSQSIDAITEEKTVFGFKIMKGLQSSSNAGNKTSTGFTRHTSLRQPVRTTNNSTTNKFRDKVGNTLFYTPKNARLAETTQMREGIVEPEEKNDVKNQLTKVDEMSSLSIAQVDEKSSDTVGKQDDNSNMENSTVNTDTEGIRESDVKQDARTSEKSDSRNINTKTNAKSNALRQNSDSEVFSVKEVEVKNKEGKIDKKLIIRTESLREGKSRLEEFREKQRRGKLTRSLTNPDYEQTESTTITKGKNISESLAEIRERIRERSRKKEQFRKSQSLPETELPPKQECEEVSTDTKVNLEKTTEVELRKRKKGSKESGINNVLSLHELEYLEIEENSKVKSGNVTVTDTTDEDEVTIHSSGKEVVVAVTNNEEEHVKDKNDNEVEIVDTGSNKRTVMDTGKEKDVGRMDKEENKEKESDKDISVAKTMQLKEILSTEKGESVQSSSLSKQKESKDDENEVETQLSNEKATTTLTSEQTKSEVKKPTKRERRKLERYQRSKTMSAIMHQEISLDAKREMQHKGRGTLPKKNDESITIPSVLEIKKRFLEAESGDTKISEPGLFYSGKTSEKSSGMIKCTWRSKTTERLSAKDDITTSSQGKSSEARCKRILPRRHTLAVGCTLENKAAQEDDVRNAVSTNDDCSLIKQRHETKSTKTKAQTKTLLSRRHTLPSFTTEISGKNNDENNSVIKEKKEVSESGGRLPERRHTFCSQSTWMISRRNPVKLSESVEALREKFSKGGAPVFNLAISSRKATCTKSVENNVDCNGRNRRRVRSDSSVQSKFITEESQTTKDTANKERISGTGLSRRHTIANRPPLLRQNSERDQQDRQEFLGKFLAKDQESRKSEQAKTTKYVDTETEQSVETTRETKVSNLRKLFHGQANPAEKKTKLRDRRAKTIAGGISPEIMGELDINKSSQVISNRHVVKPYVYVSAQQETKEERDFIERPERRRRSSDLNPDNYLLSKPLSPEETEKDCVFAEENPWKENVQPEKISRDAITTTESRFPVFTQATRCSNGESDMKKVGIVSAKENKSKQNKVESDVIDLKTPTETSLSAFNATVRRSGSDSDMNKASGIPVKDQNLDDYLSTIKTLSQSPRTSPRGSAQKEKFTASQSFEQKEVRNETRQHLDVVKTHLSMHSWSTSDLDKIIYGGDGASPSTSQVNISTMDLDEISSSTTRLQSLTEGRTKVRPKRTSSKSLNPMKSLMERTDVKTHREEPVEEENKSTSGFEKPKKRSNPRKKRSQLEPWRRHTLDPVALAALASREDFARVSLRKTKGPGKEKDKYDGSLPVMLIQVKGRRQVQTRLVEPTLSSLNTGDCFILVTGKELFCWIGEHANTIEKAKAVEISSKIQKRRDMNCKTGDVLYIDETKQGNTLAYRKFCKILQGDTTFPIEDAEMCPDDEFYEREVISTNKVYKLQEGDPPHLIPVKEQCGYMPRIAILNTKDVFVFDFGSELYLWTGQQSLSAKRKVAFHLAEMLYEQQFDSESVVTPIDPKRPLKRPHTSKMVYRDAEGNECGRPRWTLFARLHEKAETLLFQEKFFDWPDPTKIIKMKGHVSSGEVPERPPPVELKPCDATEMQKPASDLEPVILEATNLGRGLGTLNIEVNGEVKEGDLVTTLGMTVWLVTQNKHFVLPKQSEGHFHSGDGYVIRWVYFVAKNRIVRDKRGRVRPLTGRQRCAYFFWQGNECSVNEKGAAAIMAVELDEEHGPQIRVVEGKEPPHFLKLFDGAMVIHSGKRIRVRDERDEFSDNSTVRMYCIRNEDITEGCLVQVKRGASSLRSRSSFVVVDSESGNIFVWHGCKANEFHRESAKKAANFIKERRPLEMKLSEEISITLMEIEEGQESDIFWTTVSGKRNSYLSLLKDPLGYDFCPRLFHMSSATGHFISTEILNPSRYPGRTCPFPVLQDDLYSATQPTMFLLDVGDEIYVWEGWMPAEITKDKRGSAKRRWDAERKLTLQTTMSYVKEANKKIKKGAYVVQAGLEPLSFTAHFPFWNRRHSIAEIKEMEGKKDCEKKLVEIVLDNFTQKYYSFQELKSENPPDGVDPSKLESYLTDDEFQKIFEMSRDLFNQLPGWKQDVLKKVFGLF